ncbi:hypothetical protein [Acetobacter sp. KSO5]|uniref:hypothetical protein n=2 Tax=unclassified Acetobacter TaxID=2628570 RepID=UPI00376EBB30
MVMENNPILSPSFLPYGFFTLHDYATGMAVCHAAQNAGVLTQQTSRAPFGFLSAAGAAGFMGVSWWQALIRQLEQESGCQYFHALDCGRSVGHAVMACTLGQKNVILQTDSERMAAVRVLYQTCGGHLFSVRPPSFDLTGPLSAKTHLAAYFMRSYCQ